MGSRPAPPTADNTAGNVESPSSVAGSSVTFPVSRIILTGFMGAGKSTVGPLLAERLGWRFIDVDQEIEASEGESVSEIFARRGELWFRQLEHETIRRLLDSDSLVLALGGGAIEDQRTRQLLSSAIATRLIHLEVSMETVLTRCDGTDALRPILRDRPNLEGRYARRLPLYRQSHLNIAVDSLLPHEVASTVLRQIGATSEN